MQQGNPVPIAVIDVRPMFSKLWNGEQFREFIETASHHQLNGLEHDDHTQYHTDDRGDVRYYKKTELDAGQLDNRYYTESEMATFLSNKANVIHSHDLASGTTDGFMSSSDYTKLANIENGATANQTDAYLLSRANHTGTQDVSTITGLTKSSVGLGNVDNTSDLNKPISTATQTALDNKVDKIAGKGLSTNDFTDTYKGYVDVHELAATELGSSVNTSGGIVSLTGGVNFSISSGVGYTRNNLGAMIRVTWNTLSGTCTNDGDNFINVDYQGNIVITSSAAQGDLIALGYIRTTLANTVVVGFSNTRLRGTNHWFYVGELFRSSIGTIVQSGCNTAMQASPNDLKLTVGSGFIWSLFNRFTIPDTSTFTKLYNSSNYGFVVDSVTTANEVNTQYYNDPSLPAASALVPMQSGHYKKDLIALTPEGTVFYVYANTEWNTLDDARTAPTPPVPESIKLSVVRSAAIITRHNDTAITELIDIRPMFSRLFDTGQAATSATVISHSDLTNLNADDHSQYHTDARGDARYYRKTELDGGALDTRYYTETEVNSLLANKANSVHTHVAADITDLSKSSVGLGNVQNVDQTDASNITSGTLSNSRLTSNLSEIGGIVKSNGDIISVVGGVYSARTISQYKTDLSLNNVPNVDTTNASNISSGTLNNARLSTNLSQIGGITFNTNDIIFFNGTTLVNRSPSQYKLDLSLTKSDVGLGNVVNVDTSNASNISSGTLSNARLTPNLSQIGGITFTTGDYIQYNGSSLVNVTPAAVKTSLSLIKSDVGLGNVQNVDTTNASNIASGTLSNARLSVNLSQLGGITFNANDFIQYNGSTLVNVTPSTVKTSLNLTKSDVGLSNVPNVDTTNASNITTGTLPLSVIPAGALERMVIVADQTARFALTTASVQNGDTVKQNDTGTMYFVVDDTNLNNASGYQVYTAGAATSVPYSGITGLPTNISQLGNITFTTNDIVYYNGSTVTSISPTSYKALLSLTKSDVGLNNVVNSLQVINAGNGVSFASGNTASRPTAGTNGRLYASTDNGIFLDNGTSWVVQQAAISGDISIAANSTTATLATVNSNVGTFNNVTVNAKGLVTAASNVAYLTGNQTITLSGDVSGSGTTAITVTLPTVNSNVGTFNNVTVNAKGQVTAATNVAYLTGNQTIALSGDFTGSGTTAITGTLATVNSNVGTFGSSSVVPVITVNGKGLVTAVSTATITPTSIGLGNVSNSLQVINAGNAVSYASGTFAARSAAGTNGRFYYSTDQGIVSFDNGSTWANALPAYSGDVTSTLGGTTLTLATVNSNVGTFNNVTVNAKGLVTAASNVSYLTGNQTITVSGDATGSGTTGISLTLATVNSNVGTFGSSTVVPVITVNGKGLVTSVSTATLTSSSVGLGNVTNSLQVINAGGLVSKAAGVNASKPAAGTTGREYYSTDQGITYYDNGTSWVAELPAYTGDVTSSQGGTALTLATVNSNVGTFNNVTVNAKGLVTSATNANYLGDSNTNGIVVRTSLNTTTARTITGTTNQITVNNGDGTAGNPTILLADNPVLPGTGSVTLPSGTTAQRDSTAVNGKLRWNSDLLQVEVSDTNTYRILGKVTQFFTGNIAQTTGTTILPYDATLPTSTEGFQIWTQTITPTYTNSTIVVISNIFAESSTAGNAVTMSLLNGTTCIATSTGMMVTTTNSPFNLAIVKTFSPGVVTPITLSARVGPNAAATVYVNRGNTETFGGTTNTSFIVMEII